METNIFIFKTGSLGDSIVALPAIEKLYKAYKKEMYFITNKPKNGIFPAWKIYQHTTYFRDYFEYNYDIDSILELKKFIKQLNSKNILYYFVDKSSLFRNVRNYIFFKLIGFDEVYGWKESVGRYIEKDNYNKLMEVESEYVRLEKIVNKYLKLPLKNSYSYDFIKFDSSFQQYCLKTFGFLDKPFITLGIGGKTKIQRWDIGNYIEVLDKVSNDINFVILGGKDDINNADLICKKSENKNIINLCAETSILESAYILSRTKLYFGNDTGTLHLASIVGAKCLVVSSARDNINRWNPYGNNHMVIRKHPSCEGCWLHQDYCSFDIKCMTDISVDEVFDKLIKVIND